MDEEDLRRLDEAFGRVLAELRRERRLAQRELGAAASRAFVSELERGLKSPSLRTIARLARALGTSPAELVRRAEDAWRRGGRR